MNIKILDCTLRDGGYVNAWNFGEKTIRRIVGNLTDAGIDIVEIGFLQSKPYTSDKTLFRTVAEFSPFIPAKRRKTEYCGMITFGDYPLDDIPENDGSSVDGFRIIFKKKQWREALDYCQAVKNKGWKIFINPMHTYNYSDRELLDLVDAVNAIQPTGFSIVDTMGVMSADNLVRMFMLVDHNLADGIRVCFHSHNNLQQSFTNAAALINCKTKREIVIDVSVMGMGRGAGNLNAELMISHLNENCGGKYDLLPILKIADEHISKIFARTPWGYNLPYFLAASVKCHPNYASYLIDKQTISVEAINAILLRIPDDKKAAYDEELIKRLYLDYQENAVDDDEVINALKTQIGARSVLIVSPGKSLNEKHNEIINFIMTKKPFVIATNFRPDKIKADKIFISNAKRFAEQRDLSDIIVTSNIKAEVLTLNYASYLNNSEMHDNSVLMLLAVLMKLGIREAYAAGLDGFADNDNYADPQMVNNAKLGEFDKRNQIMRQMIKRFDKQIRIHFITPSLYEEDNV